MAIASTTAIDLADLKASATNKISVVYDASLWTWTIGDFTGEVDDVNIVSADSTPMATGAWVRQRATQVIYRAEEEGATRVDVERQLRAQPITAWVGHGIKGDGVTDDRAAIQRLLDAAQAAGGRPVHFGTKRYRISGPLRAHNVPIFFDPLQENAGFIPSGSNYTVLTMTGIVLGSHISVIAGGDVTLNPDGTIASDTRPSLIGVSFGEEGGSPLALSIIDSVRVFGIKGVGVRNTAVWDSTFTQISVQQCGDTNNAAFLIDSPNGVTCNESLWGRIQVEEAYGTAIYIHPNTLNCSINLIHSERAKAIPGSMTWRFSGTGMKLDAVRLQADVASRAQAYFSSDNLTVTNLRPEGEFPCYVTAAAAGQITFVTPTSNAQLVSTPDTAGRVTVINGTYAALDLRAGWTLVGGAISRLSVGATGPDQPVRVFGATIGNLLSSAASTNGAIQLSACTVASLTTGGLNRLWIMNGSRVSVENGASTWGYLFVSVDASSTVVGNVSLDTCGLQLDGKIEGNLTIVSNRQTLAGESAYVTGTVTNDGPPVPVAANYLGGYFRGMRHKSLVPAVGFPKAWIYVGSAGFVSEGIL